MILLGLFKKKQFNPLIRDGILFTVFSFFNSGVNFLLIILLAKYIPPAGYGELNLFNTFVTLLGAFISLSTIGYISIAFFKRSEKEFPFFVTGSLFITLITFSVICVCLFCFSDVFETILGLKILYLILGLVISFMQAFCTAVLDIWRIKEKVLIYGIFSVLIVILNFLLSIYFIISCNQGWQGRVYAQFIATFLFFIFTVFFLICKGYIILKVPDWNTLKILLCFGVPLIPHLASLWLRQGADRYIINYYYTTAEVGIFSFALNFSNLINVIGNAFNATNSVYIYKNLAKGYTADVKNSFVRQNRLMLFLFLAITLFVILVVTIGIPLFFLQYMDTIKYIIPLCLSSFFQCLYLLFVNYLFYYNKTRQLMYITFLLSVLQVVASSIVTKYEVLYTAYLSLLISFLTFILVYLYSKSILKKNETSIESKQNY